MKRTICVICSIALLFCAQGIGAAKVDQEHVNNFAGLPGLKHAAVGVCIEDIGTGRVLAGNSQEEAIGTASNMKLVTSASAMRLLGADYVFETVVKTNGRIKDGVLYGDLIVDAKGDPTLGSRYFDRQERFLEGLCDAISSKKISVITGGLIIHEDYATDLVSNNMLMEMEDMGWDYSAGAFDFNYRDNLVDLIIVNDGKTGIKAALEYDVGAVIINKIKEKPGKEEAVVSLTIDNTPEYLLTGTVPASKEPLILEIVNPNPQVLLQRDLRQALEKRGIKWEGAGSKVTMTTAARAGSVLYVHKSKELKDMVFSLLVRSDNTFADALVKEIARYGGKSPTLANGCDIISEYWSKEGVDTTALFQQDGSGLARRGQASAHVITDILAKAAQGREKVKLPDVMPVLGRDKSIGHVIEDTSLTKRISFKSGSMTDVQCYSGYYPADTPRYSWSILVNNFTFPRKELKKQIDLFLLSLFKDEN